MTSEAATLRKRSLMAPVMALGALALLAGAIGYRIHSTSETEASADMPAAMSTPLSMEELQARAQASDDDALPWNDLALAHFERNEYAEAAEAYRRATQIDSESASLWSALGESLTYASEADPLPAEARAAFRRALALDATDPRARYFMAVEKDLDGDHEAAIADWLALLADTPPGAPWENDLVRTIEQVGAMNAIPVGERIATAAATRNILPAAATGGIPGPSQQQMAAAASLSPVEQQDMAEEMVARLAARLETEPGDVEGWIMLMRSYKTLGRESQAEDALRRAVAANPGARELLQQAAETLGI